MKVDTRVLWFGCGVFWGGGLIGAGVAPGVAGTCLLLCVALVVFTMITEVRQSKEHA